MASSLFIVGGARSGKSRHAVVCQARHRRVVFLATAPASDGDMAARIARHRAERPPHWTTVEVPHELAARLREAAAAADAVVVDCLTLWVSNLMLRGDPDAAILDAAETLAKLVTEAPADITLVSNEVGAGVHPPTAEGMRFRDLLGVVNQRLAAACDRVVLMVAGLPLTLKAPATRALDDTAVQAP